MAYVLYAPLAQSPLPLLDPLIGSGSSLPPSHLHAPYQSHFLLAMQQPSSPYAASDFTQHLPLPLQPPYSQHQPHQHQLQYAAKEFAAAHTPIAYTAAASPLALFHTQPVDYSASPPPPSSRVTDCKDWSKGRCMRGTACRFHHSTALHHSLLAAASSASAPASPYTAASPVPVTTAGGGDGVAPFFASQAGFVSDSSQPSLVGALSPTPLHYGAASVYSAFPSAAATAASFASYGGSGLGSFPSFPVPCYLPYPNSPNAAMASYGSQTPTYPLSPSFSTASFPSAASTSTAGSNGGGGVSHPSPSSASSVASSSPSSASGSSAGSLAAVSEPCRDFQHGVCFRGASCRFAHEKQLCGDWLNSKCARGGSCKFSHDKRAGPMCRDWLQGRCARGDDCRYFHSDEQQEQQQAAATALQAAGECRDWSKGRCLRGAACKFAHSASPLALGDTAAASDGMAVEVGRKRGREQPPPGSSPRPHALPIVNVIVDPALQSAFNKPLQITMTQQADTGAVHITLTNGQQSQPDEQQQQQHSDDASLREQHTQPQQQPQQFSHSHSNEHRAAGPQHFVEAHQVGDSAEDEDSERENAGQHDKPQQLKQPPQQPQAGADRVDGGAGGDVDEQIDQTDGAADGDVYLADERPSKRTRRAAGDE